MRRDTVHGRRKGRPLRPGRQAVFDAQYPRLAIDISTQTPAHAADLFAVQVSGIVLEIGIGGGEHLVDNAERQLDWGFIGAETFLNGIAKTVFEVHRRGLQNVRLYGGDATHLLDWLPPRSLRRVDLLYPDPWPKKRHFKRRFVNDRNLQRIERVLIRGGEFRFATDIASYADWALQKLWRHRERGGCLAWTAVRAGDWQTPFAGWPGTRYENKAIGAGRTPVYLTFRKTG